MKKKLARIRARIDSLDQKVVRLLNTRLKCAREIGELKRGARTRIRSSSPCARTRFSC